MEFILKSRKALLPGNLILIVLIKTFIYKSNQFNLKKTHQTHVDENNCKYLLFLQVLKVNGDEVKLNYMTRLRHSLFKWPEKEDISWKFYHNPVFPELVQIV